MASPSKAFFSYSRQDSEFALQLAKDLRAGGAAVWIDQLEIPPGRPWDTAIEEAVDNSSILLVVLSPESIQSENVMNEVAYAIEEKKLVIPVMYRECKLPLRLRRTQYVDIRPNYANGLKTILAMLQLEPKSTNDSTMKPVTPARLDRKRRQTAAAAPAMNPPNPRRRRRWALRAIFAVILIILGGIFFVMAVTHPGSGSPHTVYHSKHYIPPPASKAQPSPAGVDSLP
jgi:hypothetical protein